MTDNVTEHGMGEPDITIIDPCIDGKPIQQSIIDFTEGLMQQLADFRGKNFEIIELYITEDVFDVRINEFEEEDDDNEHDDAE